MNALIEKITTAIASMANRENNVLKANDRIKELSSLLKDANNQIEVMDKELEEVKQQMATVPAMTQDFTAKIEAKDVELKSMADAHAAVVADYQAKLDIKMKTEEAIENDIAKRSNLETAAKLAALGVPSNKIPELAELTPQENEEHIWNTFRSMKNGKDKQDFYQKHSSILGKPINNDVFRK